VRRTVAWLDDHQRVEPSSGADLEDRVIAAWQQAEETMIGRFTNV